MGFFSSSKTTNVSENHTANYIDITPTTTVQNTYDFNAAGQVIAGSLNTFTDRAAQSLGGISDRAGTTARRFLGFGASMAVLIVAAKAIPDGN